jgi:hypothetical protein
VIPSGALQEHRQMRISSKPKRNLLPSAHGRKKAELIELEYAREVEDKAIATVLQVLSGLAAPCAGSGSATAAQD